MRLSALIETAKQFPKKSALIYGSQKVSFSQLNDRVHHLAAALKSRGVQKGDRIAFYLPNCVEYVYAYLTCFALGAVGVPLDYQLKEEELLACLEHSEAKLLICTPKDDLDLVALQDKVESLEQIITCLGRIPGVWSMEDLVDHGLEQYWEISIDDDDPALIMYTSGTTGQPKGILLNYRHLNGSPKAMEHFVDLTDKDIKLAAIPLSHIGGFIYVQNCVLFGITLILMDRFNPMKFLENIAKYKITCFHIVPAMYYAILSLKQIEKFDLSSLRWVVVFGAPSSPDMLKRFHMHCPNAKFLNGWGMTETCPPNTVTPMDSDNIASVGKPAPHCEIKIFDDKDQEVSVGDIGEVVIRGWIVMQEYFKDPKETEKIKRNGWLHTGDLGRFDKNGFLYIVGRKKEMIKVGGQIVYAPEVEAALYKHEGVQEAAVVGVSNKLRGEVIKAFVVLKKGIEVSSEDLRYFAKEHLANFKVPASVEILGELPKNRTGKVDKEELKKGLSCPTK